MLPRPPTSPLFPYTTLFRSVRRPPRGPRLHPRRGRRRDERGARVRRRAVGRQSAARGQRSEEHTSELQSPCNLVCRLLLEKKKIHTKYKLQLQSTYIICLYY